MKSVYELCVKSRNEALKLVPKYFSQFIFASVIYIYIYIYNIYILLLLLKSRFFINVAYCVLITKSVIQNIE